MIVYKYQYYINKDNYDLPLSFITENKDDEESYNDVYKRIVKDLSLNFGFVFTFGTAISAFFPIVEQLINNVSISGAEINKETIVYLTICALAISFQEPKNKYKKLFEELRLRGVYGSLKPLVSSIEGIKKLFNLISKKIGKMITTIADMFGYTALFVPFALTFATLIKEDGITLTGLVDAFSTDSLGKLLSTSIGVGTFTMKNLIIDIIDRLKTFSDKGIERVRYIINKLKDINSKDFVSDIESNSIEVSDEYIKKYSEFSEDEIIQEND